MTMEAHASGRSSLAKANGAPRWSAKTRTTGQPRKHLARKGSGRCRLHGGRQCAFNMFRELVSDAPPHRWNRAEPCAVKSSDGGAGAHSCTERFNVVIWVSLVGSLSLTGRQFAVNT